MNLSMNFKIVFFSLTVLLSACGGGGSSSGGSSGELGRCEFTVDSNNVPQVTISISTGNLAIDQEIRSSCGQALSRTRNEVKNCFTSPTTPEMYPIAIRIKDEYILETRSSNGGGGGVVRNHTGTLDELPFQVTSSVIFNWMLANGFTTSFGCGSYSK